jgi:hypothetical protein
MSRNGSGTYTLPAGNPVVTGTTIASTWANTTLSDIASALTDSVAADGQTTMTGQLDMGNNKVINLADGSANSDAVNYGQLQAALGTVTGRVVQMLSTTTTTPTSTTSSSLVNTGLSLAITPTSASNKILVMVTQPLYSDNGGFATQVRQALLRDSTVIFDDSFASQANQSNVNRAIILWDAPATASSVTYKTQMAIPGGSGTIAAQNNSLKSSIVLMEIEL